MKHPVLTWLFLILTWLATSLAGAAYAQEPRVTGDQDGSSEQVEESDEAYRRRMELEDARYRDPTYTVPGGTSTRELEKIDKLPPESRENIRDQLVDVIMANPDWKPGDALEDYPYEPTEAAEADADLRTREQAAWDEQIEKYHAREAEAFGAYRGPAGGPGNPSGETGETGETGSQGGQQGEQGQHGTQGGGQNGQEGSDQAERTAGTYQPQNNSQEEGPSTQGVSESALGFLMSRQQNEGQAQPQQAQPQQAQPQQAQQAQAQQAQARQAQARESETSEREPSETDMRGIIAIEDLDKLEGAGAGSAGRPPPEEEPDASPDDTPEPR